jgi:hypothetical protein
MTLPHKRLTRCWLHSADDQWYRARIRRTNPARKEADVVYVDCEWRGRDTEAYSCSELILILVAQTGTPRSFRSLDFDRWRSNSRLWRLRPTRRN